jgi:DUF3093 family protein
MGSYRERLRVPLSYWLLSVPVIALLGAELFAGFSVVVAIIIYAAFVVVIGGFLLAWSAVRIEVGATTLRAGGDILPLSAISEVIALDEKQAALMRGPRADPAAHLLLRPYLKQAVCLKLADPSGGVPYWLLGTRHPGELAAAISRNRASVG